MRRVTILRLVLSKVKYNPALFPFTIQYLAGPRARAGTLLMCSTIISARKVENRQTNRWNIYIYKICLALALPFFTGYIMLTWNLGSGPRRIFTQKPIAFREDGKKIPFEIKIGRVGRQAWLSVDGANITGRSPGSLAKMDVIPILYLGGHDVANFSTLPHDLPLHSGFQGCIFDVQFRTGPVVVPLQETRGIRGRSVGQCGTKECHRHACHNDGACLHHGATFTCICQEGWYGPMCTQSSNPCDTGNNKCAKGSTCVPLANGYEWYVL